MRSGEWGWDALETWGFDGHGQRYAVQYEAGGSGRYISNGFHFGAGDVTKKNAKGAISVSGGVTKNAKECDLVRFFSAFFSDFSLPTERRGGREHHDGTINTVVRLVVF